MRTLLPSCLAATALVAQSPVIDPRFAGLLEPPTAAQFWLPIQGFSAAQLAYCPVLYPALRVGATTVYLPDPLLCSANYAGTEVLQLVCATPQGVIVLIDATPSLALHVLAVPASTWVLPAGICIDSEHDQVVLLDAAVPRLQRIDLADLRAGNAQFQETALPSAWSAVRGIAFDAERHRIVGFNPASGELLQRSATDPNPSGGMLRPVPQVLAFGFAPTESLANDLFVSDGDQRFLTSQWTWNGAGLDDDNATLRATVATSSWSPPSPDPSGITYDSLRDRLILDDGEVEEMPLYSGANVFECGRNGVLSRTSTTLGYSIEPVGITFHSATRTFYISDDDADRINVVAAGPDGLLHTADDTRRWFSVTNLMTDPEDVAFDSARGELWIAGGEISQVHRLQPGSNGIFDGTPPNGDDVILNVDVSQFGVTDPEGIAVRPSDGGIYVLGVPKTRLIHLNSSGQFVRAIILPSSGLIKPAGLVFAPPSSGGAGDSLYVVDRGVDNDFVPSENDGRIFEYEVPAAGGPVNQPPVVNAGPDVTTAPTSPAHLAGTVSDDGLPGGPLTIQWSQLSGPGQANFTAPNQPVTDATFSAAGSYTLQLSAFDGQLTGTDTCVVNVQTQTTNQPPVVNAGPDVTVQYPSAAHLAGSVTDDGLPGGPVTIQWSQLSGPGQANFTAPNQQVNDVTFSAPGSYSLQLSAFDGQFTSTDTCVITVQQANQQPVVNAGPDVTVQFPSAAHLAGNVTDDGLPGGPVTIQWSQLSGPGQANFTSPSQQVNDVTFSAPGSYVLELAAFDGQYWSTDTCVITVQQANQPPGVNAGPDLHTTITALTTHLAGQVWDDGLPGGPLAVQWSQVSGPGLVLFTAPNQPVTDAVLVGLGTYIFQLTVSDGQYTTTDTCAVTVTLF